jgi:lysophospholipase L1-like esterase
MIPLRPAPARIAIVLATISLVLSGVQASPAVAAPAPYVAMGDSYTAGPFIPNQLGDPPGCGRSDHNYPHLVAQRVGAALRDASCSGATTKDLTSRQRVSGGSNRPQLDALDPGVGTVSLQIGGNDIGFSEIIWRCVSLLPLGTPCRDFYTRGGADEISRRIAATGPKVAAVLAEIRRRSPQARVFVVGYPAVLPEAVPGCWPVMPMAPADVPYLRDKEKELNAMLATRAAAAGATYVDLYGPSVGHDACQLPGTRWVEPFIPLSPAAPVHPNGPGMGGMANVLLGALGR